MKAMAISLPVLAWEELTEESIGHPAHEMWEDG